MDDSLHFLILCRTSLHPTQLPFRQCFVDLSSSKSTFVTSGANHNFVHSLQHASKAPMIKRILSTCWKLCTSLNDLAMRCWFISFCYGFTDNFVFNCFIARNDKLLLQRPRYPQHFHFTFTTHKNTNVSECEQWLCWIGSSCFGPCFQPLAENVQELRGNNAENDCTTLMF